MVQTMKDMAARIGSLESEVKNLKTRLSKYEQRMSINIGNLNNSKNHKPFHHLISSGLILRLFQGPQVYRHSLPPQYQWALLLPCLNLVYCNTLVTCPPSYLHQA